MRGIGWGWCLHSRLGRSVETGEITFIMLISLVKNLPDVSCYITGLSPSERVGFYSGIKQIPSTSSVPSEKKNYLAKHMARQFLWI